MANLKERGDEVTGDREDRKRQGWMVGEMGERGRGGRDDSQRTSE